MRRPIALGLAALLLAALPAAAQVQFVDEAAARGIDLTWSVGYPTGDLGAGVAMEDFDHDGDLDVFVATKRGRALGVYRNDGTTFTALSADLGLSQDRDIKQVLFADLDNDGWRDLVLTVWEPDQPGTSFLSSQVRIYRAGPEWSFTRQTGAAVDSVMVGLATGASAGDYDRDGDLDLYVGVWKAGQRDTTAANRMLRNEGDFNFTDRGRDLGVGGAKKSFQVALVDLTGDMWPDILSCEDKRGGVTYYVNNGDGTFTETSAESGLDGYVFTSGNLADGMGIGVGDYDGDRDLDVYITNIFDGNLLYRNNGDGTFTDVSLLAGTTSLRVGWGCAFFDLDNDTGRDLYVTNFGMRGTGDQGDRVYRNRGDGTFDDIADAVGVTYREDGFGMAAGDIDGNGGVDILLSQGSAPVRLLMNQGTDGNWIRLELVGSDSNRDAIGAMVTVWTGGRGQLFPVLAGESYLSTHSHVLDVGLGVATQADSVVVRWPSGRRETFTALAAGTEHLLTETPTLPPAPTPIPRWDGAAVHVAWPVFNPLLWDRFELWRTAPGPATLLGSVDAAPGQFVYTLRDIDATGEAAYALHAFPAGATEAIVTAFAVPTAPLLAAVEVRPPRPNPFNPRVMLRYYVPSPEGVRLRVYDLRGRPVAELAAPTAPGWQSATWNGTGPDGRGLPSGNYVFAIDAPAGRTTCTMTLVR